MRQPSRPKAARKFALGDLQLAWETSHVACSGNTLSETGQLSLQTQGCACPRIAPPRRGQEGRINSDQRNHSHGDCMAGSRHSPLGPGPPIASPEGSGIFQTITGRHGGRPLQTVRSFASNGCHYPASFRSNIRQRGHFRDCLAGRYARSGRTAFRRDATKIPGPHLSKLFKQP